MQAQGKSLQGKIISGLAKYSRRFIRKLWATGILMEERKKKQDVILRRNRERFDFKIEFKISYLNKLSEYSTYWEVPLAETKATDTRVVREKRISWQD